MLLIISTRENIRLIARSSFACRKFRYHTNRRANNKGADQSAAPLLIACNKLRLSRDEAESQLKETDAKTRNQ